MERFTCRCWSSILTYCLAPRKLKRSNYLENEFERLTQKVADEFYGNGLWTA